TEYMFGFDYSQFGIPSAPNGTGSTGLRMAANIVAPAAAAKISAYPEGLNLTGQYRVNVDMWINYNTSGGTTEDIGAFVGFDPSAGMPFNGAGFTGDSDGDSGTDYKMYDNDAVVSSLDNSDPNLVAKFPGQSPPAIQGDASVFDPTNTLVPARDGTLGYAWHDLQIDVDTNAGTATFLVDGFEMGTVNRSNLSGTLALSFADPFGSVSTKPAFSFGVFDNLRVTQVPEPATGLLSLVGLLALGTLRRR
ncbi:MAG: PEP-CTERM sorting domain-containing protein, partial [Planctomycetales bacterium]|nr:PEP-CTERM sorting domain-containing protein [Planctomycetales bacterium]